MILRKRKTIIIVVLILITGIMSLGYAILSKSLRVGGLAQVEGDWDIRITGITSTGTGTAGTPTYEGTSASFDAVLNQPGEYVEYEITVINDGNIDATLDSITPSAPIVLGEAYNQIIYIVSGIEVGDALLRKDEEATSTTFKVKAEFDPTAGTLPENTTTVSLILTLTFVQSDTPPPVPWLTIVSGDINTRGSEVSIGNEHFYVIESNATTTTLLSKYNLNVGNTAYTEGGAQIGIQNENAGELQFSSTNYWSNGNYTFIFDAPSDADVYHAFVYDNNSNFYTYIEEYILTLKNNGAPTSIIGSLMSYSQLYEMGLWVDDMGYNSSTYYNSSFLTIDVQNFCSGSAMYVPAGNGENTITTPPGGIIIVSRMRGSGGEYWDFGIYSMTSGKTCGVRPTLTILKDSII